MLHLRHDTIALLLINVDAIVKRMCTQRRVFKMYGSVEEEE